jgi:hypothetical protein
LCVVHSHGGGYMSSGKNRHARRGGGGDDNDDGTVILRHLVRATNHDESKRSRRRVAIIRALPVSTPLHESPRDGDDEGKTRSTLSSEVHSKEAKKEKRMIRKTEFEAELEYQVLSSFHSPSEGPLQLLRVRLHSGRKHQIRAQLAHVGLPIYGDTQYGPNADATTDGVPARIALHAYKLSLRHPVAQTAALAHLSNISVRCAPPDYWYSNFGEMALAPITGSLSDV